MHSGNSTSPFPANGTETDAIEAAAAVWLSRRDGGMNEAETAAFIRWLQQDVRHAEMFAELDDAWQGFNRLKVARPAGTARPDAGLLAPRRRRRRTLWVYAALTTAAAATFIMLAWPRAPDAGLRQNVVTAVGVLQRTELPDGSILQVNTDSEVDVQYTATERRVRLVRGEAYFTVAKNPDRPFVVSAGQVAVRAVGTSFNVRLRSTAIEVLVTEGKVQVNDSVQGGSLLMPRTEEPTPLLIAGERAMIPLQAVTGRASARVQPVTPPEVGRALAWQERRLEFYDVPLREVVAEFNRYNTHQIVIADSRLLEQRFTSTFRPDGWPEFVRLLEMSYNVIAEPGSDRTLLRLKGTR
jgi:transmembrane sensor